MSQKIDKKKLEAFLKANELSEEDLGNVSGGADTYNRAKFDEGERVCYIKESTGKPMCGFVKSWFEGNDGKIWYIIEGDDEDYVMKEESELSSR